MENKSEVLRVVRKRLNEIEARSSDYTKSKQWQKYKTLESRIYNEISKEQELEK